MQNCPQHQKQNITHNTDSPNDDAPNADYDVADYVLNSDDSDSTYTKSTHLSLRNCNLNHNITPNTKKHKKNMTPNTDTPYVNTPDAANYDAAYPYSL